MQLTNSQNLGNSGEKMGILQIENQWKLTTVRCSGIHEGNE